MFSVLVDLEELRTKQRNNTAEQMQGKGSTFYTLFYKCRAVYPLRINLHIFFLHLLISPFLPFLLLTIGWIKDKAAQQKHIKCVAGIKMISTESSFQLKSFACRKFIITKKSIRKWIRLPTRLCISAPCVCLLIFINLI